MGKVPTNRALDVLIREVVAENISKTSLSFDAYVAGVMEHYLANVIEQERSFNFQKTGDAWENNRKAAKKLQRYFSIDTNLKIPAVLIPALVNGLQEPWRSDAITEIGELLRVTVGSECEKSSQDAMSCLMEESNDALTAFLQLAWNGFGDDSASELHSARLELLQLIEAGRDALGLIDKELVLRGGGK